MARPFFAARIEDRLNTELGSFVRSRGWTERVIPYTGYGSSKFIRVLARVVHNPPQTGPRVYHPDTLLQRRGWRNFVTAPVVNATVECTIDGQTFEVVTDRNGYVDTRLPVRGLKPGWHEVTLTCGSSEPSEAPIMIVDPEQTFGLVSDIDDTVISTSLPRPLLAAWNTFVVQESARQAVAGMSELYRGLLADHPEAPIIYVSTGAWNTAPTLIRFLQHHRFPIGPLLLTDWGPTNTGWFRSGQEHKRMCLRDLAIDFPKISWILIGDDGQHDPSIYGEFAEAHPDRVNVVGIRQLTPGEQVLAHGTLAPISSDELDSSTVVPEVRAGDGYGLQPLLQKAINGDYDEEQPVRATG
ncbi:hypothetical protein CGZ93_08720 [Enemella dayhoffiae]|uniref:Phosphatidate phosphatase APP1 catalytic domain-containing protein n=1 Tax=Enemella dayhoffiae TaxID=2016507 RepID=A0A255H447_9ACTN|nr:phosphatase domain-containing protein [Enemella dayhoffiae]OYO21996.1 hypothetical protein CGZ93_08720 [Enemella dayhoffiae]